MTDAAGLLESRMKLGRHLVELSRLTMHPVDVGDLLSLGDTEVIREQAKRIERSPSWSCEVSFLARLEPRFRALVGVLQELNPSPVYVWTPLSNICGLLRPIMLGNVNFGFDFDVNADGILTMLTSDLMDQMILDFSEDSTGAETLEIEVSGRQWGVAKY